VRAPRANAHGRAALWRCSVSRFIIFYIKWDYRLAVLLMVGIAMTYLLSQEMLALAKLCYAQVNDTLNPEAKKTLQDIGNHYAQKAEELRRIEITRAVFPAAKK
jgi:hypothetical protein